MGSLAPARQACRMTDETRNENTSDQPDDQRTGPTERLPRDEEGPPAEPPLGDSYRAAFGDEPRPKRLTRSGAATPSSAASARGSAATSASTRCCSGSASSCSRSPAGSACSPTCSCWPSCRPTATSGRAARAASPRSRAPWCWGSRWWRFSVLLSSSSAPACSSWAWSGSQASCSGARSQAAKAATPRAHGRTRLPRRAPRDRGRRRRPRGGGSSLPWAAGW